MCYTVYLKADIMQTTQSAPEYLQQNELLKVLKNCDVRSRCMFSLAYGHGLRASEIASLTLEDVRGGKINCVRGKKSEHTVEDLRDNEKAALATWLKERGEADGSQMLFTSRQGSGLTRQQVYNLFRKAAELAGIEQGRVKAKSRRRFFQLLRQPDVRQSFPQPAPELRHAAEGGSVHQSTCGRLFVECSDRSRFPTALLRFAQR